MRNLEFVALVYLAERQSALQPFDAQASCGPDLTTIEVDGKGYVLDNHTILALADFIRAEMAGIPAPVALPEEPPVVQGDMEDWARWAAETWPDDDDDLPPLV